MEFRLWWRKNPQSLQAYAYGSWIRCSQEMMNLNIRHYPGQCICFTQEGFSAGATLVNRVSMCVGSGLALLCLEMFMWLRQEPRGAAGWGGEGKMWSKKLSSRLVSCYHFILPSVPKGMITCLHFMQSLESAGQNILFCFVFRFCYHKSHHSCSWWFQKLSQPFYPIFLVGKITKKCYYSSSLNSGRCLFFSISSLLLPLPSPSFSVVKNCCFCQKQQF